MPTRTKVEEYEQEVYKIKANSYQTLSQWENYNFTNHPMLLVKDVCNVPDSMLTSLSILSHLIYSMSPVFSSF